MWFKRLFRSQQKPPEERGSSEPTINQGIFYLYLIIGMQVVFVLGLLAVITAFGTVMATPMWVFLAVIFGAVWSVVYIYRKAVQKFKKFRESFSASDLSDKNYEISLLGGVLTMRVEQNPRRMLEAAPPQPLLEAKTIDTIDTTVVR